MRLRELERVAARHVPGRGKADIHLLSKGLVNDTYRVARDGRTFALRVAASSPSDLGLDRVWESRVLEQAVSAGLAPPLEYCDPQRGLLVMQWVDGRLWNSSDIGKPSNVSRMADLVRCIQALPIPAPARLMSPAMWIDRYCAAAVRTAGCKPGAAVVRESAAALRTTAALRLAALEALPRVDPVLCHSDLHALNLIDRGQSLLLLDWEYAHATDPLWDLAGWASNNDFSEEQVLDLITSYARRPPTREESLRLRILGWLYDYVCLLWCRLWPSAPEHGSVVARAQLLEARLLNLK
jgi:thiamine kinase-like enzyme